MLLGICAVVIALSPNLRAQLSGESSDGFNRLADPTNEDIQQVQEVTAVRANQIIPKRLRVKQRDVPMELLAEDKSAFEKRNLVQEQIGPLARNLQYAGWPISPGAYIAIKIIVTLAFLIPAYMKATFVIQLLVIFLVPKLVDSALRFAIRRRSEEFDKDYPVLLLQLVSFLKGGMIAMTALREAANSLSESSVVRNEVDTLIERLKLGLSEEQAIGAFGENIDHPEMELFVQSFLLHCRTGGRLSATLERLAIQVRKRQQFRKEAYAAVASERISIYAIAGIMLFLLTFIFVKNPDLMYPSFYHDFGRILFQSGVSIIILGFYWSKRITDIQV
jgi:tight adherence protein B